MKSIYVAILIFITAFSGCGPDNSPSDTSSLIQMRMNLEDIIDVELSRAVSFPLSQDDASLISEESGCDCIGTLEIIEREGSPVDNEWGYIKNPIYPECAVFIDTLTGQTECTDDIELMAGYFLAYEEEIPWP